MKTYLVGGAVRDRLLGLPVKDRDRVVVGAREEDLLSRGFKRVGRDFPVFLHPHTKEEYALARTERKIGPGYKGFDFDAAPSVTLEQDLQRRDLTINAMAEDDAGQVIDPYSGRADLEQRLLRHVSPAFTEDPLRVLRVARFAARFGAQGFRVADETLALMQKMTASGELEALVKERVWQEIQMAMAAPAPAAFIRVLRECGALKVILPEVDRLFGVPQPAKYHPEIDTGLHILLCLEQVVRLTDDPTVGWATLMHDVGKGVTDPARWPSHYGHESLGLKVLAGVDARLGPPREYSRLAALVCEHHTKLHRVTQLNPKTLLNLLQSLDALRRPERLDRFLAACEADARGRTGLEERPYPQRDYLMTVLKAVRGVNVSNLLADNPGADPESLVRRTRLQAVTGAVAGLRRNSQA